MRLRRTGRTGLWLLTLAAVAVLGAGRSKAGQTTTSTSTTPAAVRPKPINGLSAGQLPNPAGATSTDDARRLQGLVRAIGRSLL